MEEDGEAKKEDTAGVKMYDEDEDGERNDNEDDGENLMKNEGRRSYFPLRPEADCAYYMKTGLCKFGSNCKFNHPVRRKNQPVKEKVKEKDESTEKASQTECKYYLRTGGCKFGKACRYNHSRAKTSVAPTLELNFLDLPIRPGEKECPYYMRNGSCKYGVNCRFNHPDPTGAGESPAAYSNGASVSSQAASQVNMASCSSPRALNETATYVPVMFSPTQGIPPPNAEWNSYHQGEKECPYYMRNGSCKYGVNCRFNHPAPTGAGESPAAYSNGGSVSSQAASQVNMASCSSPRALNETATYVPMMFSPTQGIPPPNPEWNGYHQTSVYPSPERSLHPTPPYVVSNPSTETTVNTHHQLQMVVDEFPLRPGQPECSYFMKTGDCKYKSSNCKYHHPNNRAAKPASCAVSDKGLPLRPEQSICSRYSRSGICKFGPACKFDHAIQAVPPTVSGVDHPLPFSNSAGTEQTVISGSNVADTAVQKLIGVCNWFFGRFR